MSLLFPDPLKQADGVYQPQPPLWLQLLLLVVAVAVGFLITREPGGVFWGAWIPIGLAIAFALREVFEARRHGPRGLPLVRLSGGTLTIRHGDKGFKDFAAPLAQMAHLVVYGPAGDRRCRVIHADGNWREARPQWKPKAEVLAIEFLQERLHERVVIEAPQTAFEHARGDGPYFGS